MDYPERASVTVRRVDRPTWLALPAGVVFIDRKRVGILAGGKSKSFRVAPGEHRVSVEHALGTVDMDIPELGQGEHVGLVCGWVKGWFRAWLRTHLYPALEFAGYLVAGACGFVLLPHLHESLFSVVANLPVNDVLMSSLFEVQRHVTSGIFGSFLGMLAWSRITCGVSKSRLEPHNRNGTFFFLMREKEFLEQNKKQQGENCLE